MARRVVVSGAASGIGASLTRMLQEQGDEVVGVDLHGTAVCADLSTEEGRAGAVAGVLEAAGGRVDAVVACAGLSVPEPTAVRVNLFGAVALLEGLRPALAEAGAPRAAVVGSITGTGVVDEQLVSACLAGDETAATARARQMTDGGSGGLIYPSSKSALAQWVRARSVAPGWAGEGIALNVVAPGVVRTPMTEALLDDERMRAAMDEAVPMPLNGHAGPDAVAGALRWLVSAENTHVTGQVLYVDGGAEATLRGPGRF
ncbi:SDR family oxidoreductase [Nocardiopsis sp. HNM0947]|uniref:SDR family oxidoreductase n=1 Tax=Nocardiopsis coralli TaxID=2772213 RepID=A0ABR9PEX7_9ACTN|nr:SDR family oxidoreductase [Nocardiopsis coralli]MBE3002377.1 SDR family oxidoreductase [Nocardiopsis coralli]